MLDTAFAHPSFFRKLCKKANLKHTRHHYKLPGETEDSEIYRLATNENRIVITQDLRFDKQIKIRGTGIIIIPSYLTTSEMDLLICEFVSNKDPKDFIGKATKI